MNRHRAILFAIVFVGSMAVAAAYVANALRGQPTDPTDVSSDPAALATIVREPYIVFRNTRQGAGYGRLAVVSLQDPQGTRHVTALDCERVDVAALTGVCLVADRGVFTTYSAAIFDLAFAVRHTVQLAGIPSRVRMAPNGQLAAITVFVSGHSVLARRLFDHDDTCRYAGWQSVVGYREL